MQLATCNIHEFVNLASCLDQKDDVKMIPGLMKTLTFLEHSDREKNENLKRDHQQGGQEQEHQLSGWQLTQQALLLIFLKSVMTMMMMTMMFNKTIRFATLVSPPKMMS